MAKKLNKDEHEEYKNYKKTQEHKAFQDSLGERGKKYTIVGNLPVLPRNGVVAYAIEEPNELVVIKRTQLESIVASQGLEQFRQKEHLYSLYAEECEYIAKKIDIWTTNRDLFLVNEYVQHPFTDIPRMELETPMLLDILIKICSGLQHIHKQKLVHRDIKPDNIRFDYDTTGKIIIPKIIDFGLACGLETSMGVAGTEQYMAPERIRKDKNPTLDIYSLGVILWEASNGKDAYAAWNKMQTLKEDPAVAKAFKTAAEKKDPDTRLIATEDANKELVNAFLTNMSEECGNAYVKKVIRKAMQPDPTSRYQSASEMKLDLELAKRSNDLDKVLALYSEFNAAEKGKIAKGEKFDLSKLQQASDAKDALKLSELEKKSHLWAVFEQQMILDGALADVWNGVRSYAEQLGFKKQPGITDVVQHYTQVKQKLFSSYNDPKQRDKVTAFAGQVVQLCDACGDSPNY